jgi:uncharacterized membrane protein YeiH
MDVVFTLLQYIGIIAFAISGALVAIDHETDVIGVVFLSFVTAFGGGIIRDVLIGNILPVYFSLYGLIITCFVTSIAVIVFAMLFRNKFIREEKLLDSITNYIDAIGIGAFSVAGSTICIEAGYTHPFVVVFMGTLSCIGGGMLRDVILSDIPFILKKRIYILACMAGSSVFCLLYHIEAHYWIAALCGTLCTFGIRVCATVFKWNMPKAINFTKLRLENAEKEDKAKDEIF